MEGPAITWKVTGSLANLKDDATVRGRDAKELRDATAEALVEVWNDAKSATASLARQVDENNSSLLVGLNESFSAVGEKINSIPVVATLSPDGPVSKIVPFTGSGSGEDANQFSMWLRRLEDVIRMKNSAAFSQVKAILIGNLDGVAREKIEELGTEEREDFSTTGPQHWYMARQTLSVCQQQTSESSSSFANRLLNLVQAATTGQNPASQKKRVLEEFVARLRPDIRYYVKLDNPATFEQAVGKAQMVEHLLAEATADRLITPATAPRSIEIKALSPRPAHQLRLRSQRVRTLRKNLALSDEMVFLVTRSVLTVAAADTWHRNALLLRFALPVRLRGLLFRLVVVLRRSLIGAPPPPM
ncbi:hypothetical protein ANCDUO_18039 [Ancylostoma duodenale]|uniref:Uncharacterized protein n=1 Tax=Ancylostoma duodenale TaxID=51022 RepID=A0A0C2G4D4_9BILA|nr:hypothetical protein ANCDUO_18039 [Ancylostoma duodenale]